MTSSAKFIGIEKLKQKLKSFPKELREANWKSIQKSSNELAGAIRLFAPVASGALRNSIRVKFNESTGSARIVGGDDDAFYAHWVEFGNSTVSANPFFFPTYRAYKKRIRNRNRRNIRNAAKRLANS